MGQKSLLLILAIPLFIFYPTLIAGTPSVYTDEELKGAQALRNEILEELTEDYMTKDAWLVPRIRASKFDIKAAITMIRNTLDWRKMNRMNEILNEDFSKIRKIFPYWMDGYDREGRPVVELPLGQWDVRRAILSGQRNQLSRFLYQFLETGSQRIREAAHINGENITQLELIMDINGYSAKSHGCLSCFPLYIDFITSYERHYPQMARNITLINCPRISESLLQLLRTIMTPASSKALQIYGYDKGEWKDLLLYHIHPQELSTEFGGKKVRQPPQPYSPTTERTL